MYTRSHRGATGVMVRGGLLERVWAAGGRPGSTGFSSHRLLLSGTLGQPSSFPSPAHPVRTLGRFSARCMSPSTVGGGWCTGAAAGMSSGRPRACEPERRPMSSCCGVTASIGLHRAAAMPSTHPAWPIRTDNLFLSHLRQPGGPAPPQVLAEHACCVCCERYALHAGVAGGRGRGQQCALCLLHLGAQPGQHL